jgi:diguanylate cyclase (GGDEF) domain
MYDKEISDVYDKIKIFGKMYEILRFVDPVKKKVLNFNDNYVNESDFQCFEFWDKNQICDNCISVRALNENETFVKIEYTKDRVYVVTSVPFELTDRRIVIELLKDNTNSMIFSAYDDKESSDRSNIYSMINNMNNLALRDALTGVYNRRYINERLPVDIINAAILDRNLSIILTDIDFFKRVNDTYGHLVGDSALKIFADTILNCIPAETGWLARYGGEEFLVCLPDTNIDVAAELAELMRKTIEDKLIICGEHVFKITASFGVCCEKPKQGEKVEEVIQLADTKLYIAKNNGRNRVEL